MNKLTTEQVIKIHSKIIEKTGGVDYVRDYNLLDSAINAPFQTFSGCELYPTLEEKATRLGFNLVMNHPFYDGNKRIGAVILLTFLKLNEVELFYTQKELEDIILDLANEKIGYEELVEWVKNHLSK